MHKKNCIQSTAQCYTNLNSSSNSLGIDVMVPWGNPWEPRREGRRSERRWRGGGAWCTDTSASREAFSQLPPFNTTAADQLPSKDPSPIQTIDDLSRSVCEWRETRKSIGGKIEINWERTVLISNCRRVSRLDRRMKYEGWLDGWCLFGDFIFHIYFRLTNLWSGWQDIDLQTLYFKNNLQFSIHSKNYFLIFVCQRYLPPFQKELSYFFWARNFKRIEK